MTNKTEHTGLPWRVGKVKETKNTVIVPIEQGMAELCHVIGSTNPMMDWFHGASRVEANAQFIVTAANYHYRLVEALRDMVELFGDCAAQDMMYTSAIHNASSLVSLLDTKKA